MSIFYFLLKHAKITEALRLEGWVMHIMNPTLERQRQVGSLAFKAILDAE